MITGSLVERCEASHRSVLLIASAGCAMTVLDTNVVAIVLPAIARDFGASFADIEWVISAYVLCFAALLLPAGTIADRYGRRRVFFVGITGFALASGLCGMASSALYLTIARALQGVGAAFMLAPALAIIGHAFHENDARNKAWSVWGSIMGLTMVLSPLVGGVVAHFLGWRWAFYLNIPICLALVIAAAGAISESRDEEAQRLDPWGVLTFAGAMFGFTSALINGQAQGWASFAAVSGLVFGTASLALFIAIERVQRRPMLDLGLYRERRFLGSVWAMFAYAVCAQVMASLLPLFFQNGMGRTALEAGFSMLPFALAMLVFPHVGRYLGRWLTAGGLLGTGLTVVGLGSLVTALGAYRGEPYLVTMGMLVLGSGGGLLNGETQKAIMSVVPRGRAGMASGISTTSRFSGILLGFVVLGGVLATVTRQALMSGNCGVYACDPDFIEAVVAGDMPGVLAGLNAAYRVDAIERAMSAYSSGFSAALVASAMVALASAPLVYWLLRQKG